MDDLKVVGKAGRSEAKMVDYSAVHSVGNLEHRLDEMTAGMWAVMMVGYLAWRKVVKMAAAMVVDWAAKQVDYLAAWSVDNSDKLLADMRAGLWVVMMAGN